MIPCTAGSPVLISISKSATESVADAALLDVSPEVESVLFNIVTSDVI